MGRIVVLDENTANQIAAGEVVEGPASIVKEMVENAVDAGASQVQVDIRNGGIRYIRVTDNGCGMERDDVEMAFERHATSKLRKIDDLDEIRSMGFRGEALASIASVSRMDMITRTPVDAEGTKVKMEGGTLLSVEPAGGPAGTTFVVRDLFYNTPARYKFLKKDATEAARVEDVMERLALAHPDVAMQLVSGGETVLRTPGNGDLASAIYALYGRQTAEALLPLTLEQEGIRVSGFVGRPAIARGNRARQTFLMNGRVIRSATLTAALDEGFRTLLMTRQYAFAVLVLEIPPLRVDVNVHPAKLEVRFAEERAVFSAVHGAVRNALLTDAVGGGLAPTESFGASVSVRETHVAPTTVQQRLMPEVVSLPADAGARLGEGPSRQSASPLQQAPYKPLERMLAPQAMQTPQMPADTALMAQTPQMPVDADSAAQMPQPPESAALAAQMPQPPQEASSLAPVIHAPADLAVLSMEPAWTAVSAEPAGDQSLHSTTPTDVRHPAFLRMRQVGQVFNSFIVLELEDEMLLLDQHAAHERIRFEDLRWGLRDGNAPSQPFLQPVALHLSAMEMEQAMPVLASLERIGFEMESFGGNTLLVRAIPATFDGRLSEAELSAIVLEGISDSGNRQGAVSEETLHRISCKGAIKANRTLSALEIHALLERLSNLENPYTCVHGRPILLRFPRRELEKRFKRIV